MAYRLEALRHRRTKSDDVHCISYTLSDDDNEDFDASFNSCQISGTLYKWTNYIHGWQGRYFILKNGVLSYYKCETETDYGCRGSISIHKALIKPHEFDECRFDMSVNDCVWYLRSESLEDKQRWIDSLEAQKGESGFSSESSLCRHGSTMSVTSNTLSTASTSSFRKGKGLKEKLAEIETFRDILCKQVDTLQEYFDACSESYGALKEESDPRNSVVTNGELDLVRNFDEQAGDFIRVLEPWCKQLFLQHGKHGIDFKGEAITFKATTAGILATLSHCIDIMVQREDGWRKRLEREVDKRRRIEELYKHALHEAKEKQVVVVGGPDFEEGPHSSITEEEFFDAVETSLDKLEEAEQLKILQRGPSRSASVNENKATLHPLWREIDSITREQLSHALESVESGLWTLFAEEGEMRMYKREEEIDGLVCDPLKAVHTVKGVSGHEMCHYFFSPDVRLDWETTLETMKILETISEDTLVFHQVHKRVWPAAQRDALFWSHIRSCNNPSDSEGQDVWIVCNHSTRHIDVPVGKCVRVGLTVSLVCQTFVDPPKPGCDVKRSDVTCRITYCSVVNPGGWAPAAVLRTVYKREYPKFLKRFTRYVQDQCEAKPVMF